MKVRELTFIGIFTTIIAVCSWISIPTVVPFTLQTLGIFLAVELLGGKRGSMAVLVYILLGAIGLPVFAGFSGGIGVLLGCKGGYIIGFITISLVIWGIICCFGDNTLSHIIGMLTGLLVCYTLGTAWFLIVYTRSNGYVSLRTVISWCVLPFIIPDLVKLWAAFLITKRLKPHIHLD